MRTVSATRPEPTVAAEPMKLLLDSIDRLERLTAELQRAIKPRRLIPMSEVEGRVSMKKSAIYARIKEGTFPAQGKEGEMTAGFLESEIDAWIEARMRERDESDPLGK